MWIVSKSSCYKECGRSRRVPLYVCAVDWVPLRFLNADELSGQIIHQGCFVLP